MLVSGSVATRSFWGGSNNGSDKGFHDAFSLQIRSYLEPQNHQDHREAGKFFS